MNIIRRPVHDGVLGIRDFSLFNEASLDKCS